MPSGISVDFVNPFIHSTINALETMAFTKTTIGKPFIKLEGDPKADISGSIGMTGEVTGTITVNFTKDIACELVSRMIHEEHNTIDATVRDGVGEIANMVGGGAKGEMQAKNMDFCIALPTVTLGPSHTHSHPANVTCMVIPFTIDAGEFTVEIALKTG